MIVPADRTIISHSPLSGSLPRLASVYLSLTPPDSGSVIDRGLDSDQVRARLRSLLLQRHDKTARREEQYI